MIEPLRGRLRLTLHRQPNAGPAAARNAGAARAVTPLLAFTDDDTAPEPGWLARLTAHLARAPDALVGGHTVNGLPGNPYATASQLLIDYLREADGAGPLTFAASNNIALARAGFEAVGGFDPGFPLAAGEDRAFCSAWRRSGRPIRYAPDARIRHFHGLDLRSFWRQHEGYGRGAYVLRQRTPAVEHRRPAGFYRALVTCPLRQPHLERAFAWRVAALMAVSQAATAAGYAREAARNGAFIP